MVLSAEDIHNKKFSTKMRGYNIDEVNDFLDQITKDYQILKDNNQELTNSLKKTKEELSYYDDLKGSLNQSILVAQEAADRVKKQADEDAEQTFAAAQNKANQLVNNATREANRVIVDGSKKAAALAISTNDFRANIKTFREKMIGMLQSQLDFANNSEWAQLLDGADFENFDDIKEIVSGLDKQENDSVDFDDNEISANASHGKFEHPTVLIFPNGEIRSL